MTSGEEAAARETVSRRHAHGTLSRWLYSIPRPITAKTSSLPRTRAPFEMYSFNCLAADELDVKREDELRDSPLREQHTQGMLLAIYYLLARVLTCFRDRL